MLKFLKKSKNTNKKSKNTHNLLNFERLHRGLITQRRTEEWTTGNVHI